MTILGTVFALIVAVALLTVPRKWALVPFLVGSVYFSPLLDIELGGLRMPAFRLLLLVGLIRTFLRGERLPHGLVRADKLVLVMAAWILFANLFHEQKEGAGVVYTLGTMFTLVVSYFLARIWCDRRENVVAVIAILAVILLPVGLSMIGEKLTGRNLLAGIAGVSEKVMIRNGELRASGPFRHPILAGTIGAACLPLMIGIWRWHRGLAATGVVGCLAMVMASHSSGPLVGMVLGVAFVCGWKYRRHARTIVWLGIIGYIAIEILATRPAYKVILTRLDFTGSSTVYYRARLIDVTIGHFSEWWAFGTDKTKHWLPDGIGSVIGEHLDITNYYIGIGITGGLVAMVLMVVIVMGSLRRVVDCATDEETEASVDFRFLVWCVGAGMFSHAASAVSICYFDQSANLFWFNVALITALAAGEAADRVEDEVSAPDVGGWKDGGKWSSKEEELVL